MRQSGSKFRTGLEVSANQPGKNLAFRKWVVPYVYANAHPRAWGWVIGAGTPRGIAHQMWSAALNSNVFGADQSPDYV